MRQGYGILLAILISALLWWGMVAAVRSAWHGS